MNFTVLGPIATANPDHCVRQSDAALNMQNLSGLSRPLAARVPAVYKLSGIERRFTCVAEYARDPSAPAVDPIEWPVSPFSTTAVRNEAYRAHSIPLALRAAAEALSLAQVAGSSVTHVVVTSCTGFFAPGLDIALAQGLSLNPGVQRTLIGFMGCYAAFNALRLADAFCQAQQEACVLLVSLELCSLHFQVENTLESVAVNSLFADGCAALVARPMQPDDPRARGLLRYERGCCALAPGSLEMMSWDIGDQGFKMGLSNRVPDVLQEIAPEYLNRLLQPIALTRQSIDRWAIHPGGRRIVESVQAALGLAECDVADSLAVLRDFGNMSSPTILFVLQRILREHMSQPGERIAAMAFGPGLTVEGCVLRKL